MIVKTLIIWRGEEETDESRGSAMHFTCDKLEKNADTYVLKNKAGEVLATVMIGDGCHAREL